MNKTTKLTATTLAVMLAGAPVGAFAFTGGQSNSGAPSPTQGFNQTAPTGNQGASQAAPTGSQSADSQSTGSPSMGSQSMNTKSATPGDHSVSRNTVAEAQQKLQQEGQYQNGHIDGVLGPRTHTALENFQRAHGLTPSGQLDGQTLAALGVNQQSTPGTSTNTPGRG